MDIAAALLGVAGSAVGAWVGATFALRKFKSERAFDRRLQWLDAQFDLLGEARTQLQRLHRATETQDKALAADALDALAVAHERLETGLAQMIAYINAGSPTFPLYTVLYIELGAIIHLYRIALPAKPVPDVEQMSEDLQVGLNAFSLELKSHMGTLAGSDFKALNELMTQFDAEPADGIAQLRRRAGLEP